jgi:thiol-disulfide isomerase/thioredoxin
MQKIFRGLAFVLFVLLIFSPLYFKYIKHHLQSNKLENLAAKNITNTTIKGSNNCSAGSMILFPRKGLQILHFFSLTCPACARELKIWEEADFASIINLEVIHITTTSTMAFPQYKDTLEKFMSYKQNFKTCFALLDDKDLEHLNLGSLPSTFIIKDGKIIYTISGKVDASDFTNITKFIQNNK